MVPYMLFTHTTSRRACKHCLRRRLDGECQDHRILRVKAGVINMTRAMALEVAPDKVRCSLEIC